MLPLIQFTPILKATPWGGNRLAAFKCMPDPGQPIGETWDVSGLPGNESVVTGGPYDGLTLRQLIRRFGADLVGKAVYERHGEDFPLLIKYIDARDDLSIQVHPDDARANQLGLPFGKTEMWHVLSTEPDTHVICGLSRQLTPEEFRQAVADGTLTRYLNREPLAPDTTLFIPAGRIHTICRGTFLIEIQQSSDVTYRIYDYNRPGLDGRPRQLHVDEAIQAIDYSDVVPAGQTVGQRHPAQAEPELLAQCPYFTTVSHSMTEPGTLPLSGRSFQLLIVYRGEARLQLPGQEAQTAVAGQTFLVPAEAAQIAVTPRPEVRFLRVEIG